VAATKQPMPVGTVKATVVGSYGPTIWNNVWYFSPVTPGSTVIDTFNLTKDRLHAFYDGVFKVICPPVWSVSHYKISYRDSADSLVRFTLADAIAGTNAGTMESAQVSYLVNMQSGDPRKGGKPRKYVPGVLTGIVDDESRIQAATVTGRNTAMTSWLAANLTATSGGATGLLTLELSFRNAKEWRDSPLAFEVHTMSLNDIVATQRDRINRLRS
jgi:hypothetical protein